MRKFKITVDNEEYEVEVEELKEGEVIKKVQPTTSKPKAKSASPKATAPKQSNSEPEVSSGGGVEAPLPGVVTEILVSEGDTVNPEDVVLILEAMKMENKIQANTSGTVSSIEVREGDSVNESDLMIKID